MIKCQKLIQDFRWGLVSKILYYKFTHKKHIWHKIKHGVPKWHLCVCICASVWGLVYDYTCDVDVQHIPFKMLKNSSAMCTVNNMFIKICFYQFIFLEIFWKSKKPINLHLSQKWLEIERKWLIVNDHSIIFLNISILGDFFNFQTFE